VFVEEVGKGRREKGERTALKEGPKIVLKKKDSAEAIPEKSQYQAK